MKLPNNKRIGIIGGGQLGKMLIEASRPWNIKNVVLENDLNCPASLVADEVIQGGLYDADKIQELAQKTDILTFEIEHINVEKLLQLEADGMEIIPSPKTLKLIQDKGLQKQFYLENDIPTSKFILVEAGFRDMEKLSEFAGEKVVVKARKGGYDGKGVDIVGKSELASGEFTIESASVIEEFQEEILEISVIVARGKSGEMASYNPIEMYFNSESNLVEFLFSPASISKEVSEICSKVATRTIEQLSGTGIFAIELFVRNGKVMVNEIAPRPHNSGHHTIEGAFTSQFEQLNRILLGLPLGNTEMVCPAAMINLVGPAGLNGSYELKNTGEILEIPGVYIHLYNKKTIKPNRKMGHITLLASSFDELKRKAEKVKLLVEFNGKV